PRGINFIYIRQAEALGLGHAVLCAAPVIGEEPFAILLADDLIDAKVGVMQQMAEIAKREQYSVIGVMPVAQSDIGNYGIVETDTLGDRLGRITRIVEKPKPGTTTSNSAVVGRYILTPRIFHHLRSAAPGAGGEIQLTDAIAHLLDDEKVLAYRFEGRRYDCGNKLGYLEAMVDYGVKHRGVGGDFGGFWSERRPGGGGEVLPLRGREPRPVRRDGSSADCRRRAARRDDAERAALRRRHRAGEKLRA